jgi:hypothetical protein
MYRMDMVGALVERRVVEILKREMVLRKEGSQVHKTRERGKMKSPLRVGVGY